MSDNFNEQGLNNEWADIESDLYKQSCLSLRRDSVQALFNGYTFEGKISYQSNNDQEVDQTMENLKASLKNITEGRKEETDLTNYTSNVSRAAPTSRPTAPTTLIL